MPDPGPAAPHPSTAAILRYFEYAHLPPHLQIASRPAAVLAHQMADSLPQGPELTAGLRKLLEAKDCFVRAALDLELPPTTDGGVTYTVRAPEPQTVEQVAAAVATETQWARRHGNRS